MTRKDYIAIADALRTLYNLEIGPAVYSLDAGGEVPREGWQRWAAMAAGNLIAGKCEDDNPHFDREHFLAVVRGERDLNSRPPRS